MSDRIIERFPKLSEFEELLEEAEDQASNDWEETFCKDVRAKYSEYKGRMFLSDPQFKKLKAIASGEQPDDTYERFERSRR